MDAYSFFYSIAPPIPPHASAMYQLCNINENPCQIKKKSMKINAKSKEKSLKVHKYELKNESMHHSASNGSYRRSIVAMMAHLELATAVAVYPLPCIPYQDGEVPGLSRITRCFPPPLPPAAPCKLTGIPLSLRFFTRSPLHPAGPPAQFLPECPWHLRLARILAMDTLEQDRFRFQ